MANVTKLSIVYKIIGDFLRENEGKDFDLRSIGTMSGIDPKDHYVLRVLPIGKSNDADEQEINIPYERV